MNLIKRLIALAYMVLMVSLGGGLILLALNMLTAEQLMEGISIISGTYRYQITAIAAGTVIILLGVLTPFRLEKRLRKSRFISFSNPDGEVTISLSAVEEYVYKIAKNIKGIKDVRSHVDSRKGVINVVTDVSISATANIPEVTERIQMEVKNKIQSMLGVEEGINVKMNIKRIAKSRKDEAPPRQNETQEMETEEEDPVPHRG
ncbi:MAG: alkaline shock response membrane anchor protein AmaP [Candidatus Omnitrophota bacterium]